MNSGRQKESYEMIKKERRMKKGQFLEIFFC